MPGNKTNYFNCVLCSKRTKANERREASRAIKKVLRKTILIDSFKDNVVICNRCRHLCRKNSGQPVVCARIHQPRQNESSTKTQSSPPSISAYTINLKITRVLLYLQKIRLKTSSNFTVMQNHCFC